MAKKVLQIMLVVFFFSTISPLCGISRGGEFPTRSIELIIPWAPGGPSDTMGRIVAPELGKILGQPVVPVNKPGASGALGAALLAKAKPDGYTILIVSNSSLTVFPHFEKVAYDPLTDFTYLGKLYNQFPGLYVRIDAPWKNFEEFLDFAKKIAKNFNMGLGDSIQMPISPWKRLARNNLSNGIMFPLGMKVLWSWPFWASIWESRPLPI
jgi:tripartite-type tricarboxylate transporter receptor subunit TctC